MALLACSLSALKWDGTEADALDSKRLTPLVIDYLCAAISTQFISTANVESLNPTAYPRLDSLPDKAVKFLRQEQDYSTVVLYGSHGSERNRLADTVVRRLTVDGYTQMPANYRFQSVHDPIDTIDDFLGYIAEGLTAESLCTFLDNSYDWIGSRHYVLLRSIFDQKRLRITDRQQAELYPTLRRRKAPAKKNIDKQWIISLTQTLHVALTDSKTSLVLTLNWTYAKPGLRYLIVRLGKRIQAPMALVLVADSEIAELHRQGNDRQDVGWQLEVPAWKPEQVERFCREQVLSFDAPETITQIHQLSQGLPELVDLLVKWAKKQAQPSLG